MLLRLHYKTVYHKKKNSDAIVLNAWIAARFTDRSYQQCDARSSSLELAVNIQRRITEKAERSTQKYLLSHINYSATKTPHSTCGIDIRDADLSTSGLPPEDLDPATRRAG